MIDLRLGDCIEQMKTLGDGSIDCIITDPPYPEISRDYGRMTEAEWHEMMRSVVAQARRVLKPSGSAVFILQPNSERVGRMRPWLWEFMAWTCREWNQVQDAWWWNTTARPGAGTNYKGLMRESLKACVWLGSPDCYRHQSVVLWTESRGNQANRLASRFEDSSLRPSATREGTSPIRHDMERWYGSSEARGGVTPFNVMPTGGNGSPGHPAGTPPIIADWWTRYICPPDGTILDPFMGSGTTGLSAIKYGCSYVGIEKMPEYHAIAQARLDAASNQTPLFAG
jgi:DNA modification methylase